MDLTPYSSLSRSTSNLKPLNSTQLSTSNFDKIAFLVSKSLYKNPLLAAVREILQNALDANRASESSDKVSIIIPSYNYPFLSIKDSGNGISPDFFNTSYNSLGFSTKSSSNEFTGGFGIGKLAPLSFSSQLFINSVCNNQEHSYLVVFKEAVFSFDHLSSSPSSKPNGTEVKIPCESSRFDEVHCAVNYFCELISDKVNIFQIDDSGQSIRLSTFDGYLDKFKSSEVTLNETRIPFKYHIPTSSNSNFICISLQIGDINYRVDHTLQTQLKTFIKKNRENSTIQQLFPVENESSYSYIEFCVSSPVTSYNEAPDSDIISYSSNRKPIVKIPIEALEFNGSSKKAKNTGNNKYWLVSSTNILDREVVIHLPPNAIALSSSRDNIIDNFNNNLFIIKVIQAVLSKLIDLDNSLVREHQDYIDGNLGGFFGQLLDLQFFASKFEECNSASEPVDYRFVGKHFYKRNFSSTNTCKRLKMSEDNKYFQTKNVVNWLMADNFSIDLISDNSFSIYSKKPSLLESVSSMSLEDFLPKKSYIYCSSKEFKSFCKFLEQIKVLNSLNTDGNLNYKVDQTLQTQLEKNKTCFYSASFANKINNLEFSYFLSFFCKERKGYIVYYEDQGRIRPKTFLDRIKSLLPDYKDCNIIFVPYTEGEVDPVFARTLTLNKDGLITELENSEERTQKCRTTNILNYFRTCVLILPKAELKEKKPKRTLDSTPLLAIKKGGFYKLDPSKCSSEILKVPFSVESPLSNYTTYEISTLTKKLPEVPGIVYLTTKDCNSRNLTIADPIPPNLDLSKVYFASSSVADSLLNYDTWLTIEEYSYNCYKQYLEEFKELLEFFSYRLPGFIFGYSSDSITNNSLVRQFLHPIFSEVACFEPTIKHQLLRFLKEDWKVLQWMDTLSCTRAVSKRVYDNNMTFYPSFFSKEYSEEERTVPIVFLCNKTLDNKLFADWRTSNEQQDSFFTCLFNHYPLLKQTMFSIIGFRKATNQFSTSNSDFSSTLCTNSNLLSLLTPILEYIRSCN